MGLVCESGFWREGGQPIPMIFVTVSLRRLLRVRAAARLRRALALRSLRW